MPRCPAVQVSGEVRYNGVAPSDFDLQRTAAYVDQYDIHLPLLTVRRRGAVLGVPRKCGSGGGARAGAPSPPLAARFAHAWARCGCLCTMHTHTRTRTCNLLPPLPQVRETLQFAHRALWASGAKQDELVASAFKAVLDAEAGEVGGHVLVRLLPLLLLLPLHLLPLHLLPLHLLPLQQYSSFRVHPPSHRPPRAPSPPRSPRSCGASWRAWWCPRSSWWSSRCACWAWRCAALRC